MKRQHVAVKPGQVLRRRPDAVFRMVDGEVVMLDLDQGKYFGLDSIGSRVWEILETPCSVEEICALLVNEYEVTAETCLEDLSPFLERMIQNGLVEVVS